MGATKRTAIAGEPGIYMMTSGRYLVRTPEQRGSSRTVDASFDTMNEARAWKAQAVATRGAGGVVRPPQSERRSPVPTFGEYATAWMAGRRRKTNAAAPEAFKGTRRGGLARPQTLDGYDAIIRTLLAPLADTLVCDIDRQAVEDLVTGWAEAGYAQRTAGEALSLLAFMLEGSNDIGKNPARNVSVIEPAKPKRPRPWARPRALTLAEVRRWADQLPAPHRATLWVALLVGPRHAEICGLRLGDVDWSDGWVFIHRQRHSSRGGVTERSYTKTAASRRRLPVAPALLEYLRWYVLTFHGIDDPGADTHADRPLVVGLKRTDGVPNPIEPASATKLLARARDAAGLGLADVGFKVTLHTLRKTLGGMLEDTGLPGRLISDYLGHAHPLALEADQSDQAAQVTRQSYMLSAGDLTRVRDAIDELVRASGVPLIDEHGADDRLTLAEAGELLGVGANQAYRLLQTGTLVGTLERRPIDTKAVWLVEPASVADELERRRRVPHPGHGGRRRNGRPGA